MRVAIRKIDGTTGVDVSLNRGVAVVKFSADNRVSVVQIRDAVRSNGFTPKAAEVRIRGRVVRNDGAAMLVVPGQERAFRLIRHADAAAALAELEKLDGKMVEIEGTVPESKGRATAEIIQVRRVVPQGHLD